MEQMKTLTLEALILHKGHELGSADWGEDVNVALVCEDCQEILADWDQGQEDKRDTMPPLSAQDLMSLRGAAEALMYEFGAEDLGAELNEVGDKLTDLLKEQLDT